MFGDFGCFSFYVIKNVVIGEGGMILGCDKECIVWVCMLVLYGMSKDVWYCFGDVGYKYY